MLRLACLLSLLVLCCPLASVAAPTAGSDDLEQGLHLPYDGHPLAMLLRPTLAERYVPAGLTDEAAIRRAVADGTLREPIFPSLQLADDRAFVWLSQFAHSTLGPRSNTLVRCPGTDGFRLLLDSEDCSDPHAASLHFDGPPAGDARCRECAALNLPVRWQHQQPGAQCRLPGWNLEVARVQYATWLQRLDHDIQPFLHTASEALWKARGLSMRGSLVPHSRATASLFSMSTSPALFGASIGLDDTPPRRDLLPRLLTLLKRADVAGRGGIYPEALPEFAALCAEVWYLRVPTGGLARANPPPPDTLERDGYPFVTFVRNGDQIVLAGVSRELAQALLTLPDPE
ncbi:hypothetical protein KQ945_15930 [Bacillus subtilis subsp. subtilis]|nr:hypothetical protein [Bacillus subtilis subsp. subtilis]